MKPLTTVWIPKKNLFFHLIYILQLKIQFWGKPSKTDKEPKTCRESERTVFIMSKYIDSSDLSWRG